MNIVQNHESQSHFLWTALIERPVSGETPETFLFVFFLMKFLVFFFYIPDLRCWPSCCCATTLLSATWAPLPSSRSARSAPGPNTQCAWLKLLLHFRENFFFFFLMHLFFYTLFFFFFSSPTAVLTSHSEVFAQVVLVQLPCSIDSTSPYFVIGYLPECVYAVTRGNRYGATKV